MSKPNVKALPKALILSKLRLVLLGGLEGSSFHPNINATIPKGKLIRNSQFHEAKERMSPAHVGPDAADTEMTMALMAIPRPNILGG